MSQNKEYVSLESFQCPYQMDQALPALLGQYHSRLGWWRLSVHYAKVAYHYAKRTNEIHQQTGIACQEIYKHSIRDWGRAISKAQDGDYTYMKAALQEKARFYKSHTEDQVLEAIANNLFSLAALIVVPDSNLEMRLLPSPFLR